MEIWLVKILDCFILMKNGHMILLIKLLMIQFWYILKLVQTIHSIKRSVWVPGCFGGMKPL